MRPPCFECGSPSEQDHHVVARVHGGSKTVPLCLGCHGRIHGIGMAHRELVKAGLAAYKAAGGVLGSARPECRDNLSHDARKKGAIAAGVVARELADAAYADLVPQILEWRSEGLSQRQIAARLNQDGHRTRLGKPWNQVQVMRLLRRFPA